MKIVVATRGSRLSLVQTNLFLQQIRAVEPNVKFEIKIVKTTGDIIQDKPLYAIGVKGIFEKEVNLAVLRGEADIAVHSLKDLPSAISDGLVIAGYSKRDLPYDVLVSREGYTLETLPPGAVVGTSSVRRAEFLKVYAPHVKIEPLRGNVDTRLAKVASGQYDAAVMAAAGILRLDKPPLEMRLIPPEVIPPPPGQGIVVAVARQNDSQIVDLLQKASDPRARVEATAERAFLQHVGAGCHVAVGGIATWRPGGLQFIAGYANSGAKHVAKIYGEDPEEVGRKAAEMIKKEMLRET